MTDEQRVRERFIELLRERTPDHPFVLQHDRKQAERHANSIDHYVEQTCADCPRVWRYSCACYGWCMKTGENLPDSE